MLDASVALSWFFDDEHDALSKRSAERVLRETAIVPALFPAEVANALFFALKKQRIPEHGVKAALTHIADLPIRIDSPSFSLEEEIALARRYRLTIYDALYLALARRQGVALWTRDVALRRAATAENLEVMA
ncbi:MAG TPA: type II toxin-antitoxin system VapC family toxin [Candidatus Tyrphobacter sp.]